MHDNACPASWRRRAVFLLLLAPLLLATRLEAANGIFTHGAGGKSSGAGGIGYVAPEDSYPVSANPALAAIIDGRTDLGLEYENVRLASRIEGNLLGADQSYSSRAQHFFIPQFGFVAHPWDVFSFGMSGFAAGFGSDYEHSPYQRFGGARRASVGLGQAGVSSALAISPVRGQAIGVSLNLAYQQLAVKGLNSPLFQLLSEQPDKLSNQGRDSSFGAGFAFGWNGLLAPWLEVGACYRSKIWSQKFHDYAGLLPDQGRLDLPAIYGAGVAVTPVPRWTLALEVQEFRFADEKTTGNGVEELLANGHRLGSDDGPGFGWNNQTVWKLGLSWTVHPGLQLRAGYTYAEPVLVPRSETLLNMLAANPARHHYTLGATVDLGAAWEMTVFASATSGKKIRGEGSIPLLLGGGEATAQNRMLGLGVSFGRRGG